jgi:hypothetical protein
MSRPEPQHRPTASELVVCAVAASLQGAALRAPTAGGQDVKMSSSPRPRRKVALPPRARVR